MKSCELCKMAARTYCESDQASLCWDCDAKVHGANFLVARHVRCLLCHTCQSVTPWRAAGAKLGHTVSVCEMCVNGGREESEAENDDDNDDEEEEEEVDSDDDVSVDDDVEDGDNQVVPWSTVANTPPPAVSSSSSEDSSAGEREVSAPTNIFSLKRLRENASDLRCEDDLELSSPKRKYGRRTVWATRRRLENTAVSTKSVKMMKDQPVGPEGAAQFQSDSSSRAAANMESLEKLERDKSNEKSQIC